MVLGSEFLQNLMGTPLAICAFGTYLSAKPFGGRPLRSVDLGFELTQNLRGTPLAICGFWI